MIDACTLGEWFEQLGARLVALDVQAQARAEGRPTGRPAVADQPELAERIRAMRDAGMSLRAIAQKLNDDEVPTLRGGAEWRASSVEASAGYQRPRPKRRRVELPTAMRSAR